MPGKNLAHRGRFQWTSADCGGQNASGYRKSSTNRKGPEIAERKPVVRTERVGFEPTVPFGTPVFETGTINRSVTSPTVTPFASGRLVSNNRCGNHEIPTTIARCNLLSGGRGVKRAYGKGSIKVLGEELVARTFGLCMSLQFKGHSLEKLCHQLPTPQNLYAPYGKLWAVTRGRGVRRGRSRRSPPPSGTRIRSSSPAKARRRVHRSFLTAPKE